ncbi:hypothetical protein [Latilactobacillus graminis]|uniref:DNA-directed RNA polymerase beta subunit n=2 Tax=Latilactobacillus graminis TaxID=60519 RepID=A0AA89I7E8_9LACO|nr:hypothetical protein [Latilactobacillus graminis]KRM22397.1 hypothetical protein FC90_GL000999 [Latilactobacillus graminis DSM 20719]QFP79430.1 hypothetical protein LG542_03945 [Latilactobacillus graminis]
MNNTQYDPNLVNQFLKYDYHDRGMMKWQGFYLSDHTAVMDKNTKEQVRKLNEKHIKPMTNEEIANTINTALVKNLPVQIDKAERTIEGTIPSKVTGLISGWFGSQIIVNNEVLLIADIYALTILKSKANL